MTTPNPEPELTPGKALFTEECRMDFPESSKQPKFIPTRWNAIGEEGRQKRERLAQAAVLASRSPVSEEKARAFIEDVWESALVGNVLLTHKEQVDLALDDMLKSFSMPNGISEEKARAIPDHRMFAAIRVVKAIVDGMPVEGWSTQEKVWVDYVVTAKEQAIWSIVTGTLEGMEFRPKESAPSSSGWKAAQDVISERKRQMEKESWSPEHDDGHKDGEIASAAAAYARVYGGGGLAMASAVALWPWDMKWFKPKSQRENLVRAGALILAEIERLDRLPAPPVL